MATILHAIIGYFILLFVVRVLARRAGSQMALFEFVLIFLLGGVIILSTVGNDRSVTNCTCAVMAVGFMHRLVSWAKTRSPRIGAIVDGTPMVAFRDGAIVQEVMDNARLRENDLLAAARTHGVPSLDQVDYAILERNGRISIISKKS
uniref:Putative conserved membrane-anchored protein n=1 Tax=uncultured bacterium RM57 TaxID=561246 RepID=C8XT83_9BACT|nr:putative conserved membrane-anchored protein [uncultured bacterium RM57]